MSENYMEYYRQWLESPYLDEESRKELLALKGDRAEIELRFLGYLEFGTGGLRGTMGAGTNKMNVYTVAHATQGMAEMILLEGQDAAARGVVIAYDSRNNSEQFARTAASVLSANPEYGRIFSTACVRRRSFRLRSVNWAVLPVSTLPRRIIQRSITAIKLIGKTVRSFLPSMPI